MKYAFVFASILVLAGCGSLSNNDVESEIVIDTPESISGEGELFAPVDGDRINLQEDVVISEETTDENGEVTEDDLTDTVTLTEAQQDATEEEVVDVTPEVVETITNRVSPVTGPAIPEAEMLKILETK